MPFAHGAFLDTTPFWNFTTAPGASADWTAPIASCGEVGELQVNGHPHMVLAILEILRSARVQVPQNVTLITH